MIEPELKSSHTHTNADIVRTHRMICYIFRKLIHYHKIPRCEEMKKKIRNYTNLFIGDQIIHGRKIKYRTFLKYEQRILTPT